MSLDNALIGHVLFCALLAATASLFRPKPRVSALVLIGAAGLAITIRDRAIGYLIAIAIVYAVCTAILALTRRSYLSSSTRWRGAVTIIATVAIGFSALRIGGSESLELDFAGHRVAILALDMWLVLRLVTFVWEVGSGRVASLRFIDFFAWISSPFTLIGPVLRYDESIRQRTAWLNGDAEAKSHRCFYDRRIVVGATQMALGYALTYSQAVLLADPQVSRNAHRLFTFLLAGPWSFYLVIAGYMKLMECFAKPWGIDLPPSFDNAFAQKNLADFWARWNMSATAVFRDYVFYARWGLARPNVYVNTMIVFLLVGLWHAANGYWLLWGFLHGAGFCSLLLYRRYGAAVRATFNWVPGRVRMALACTTTYLFVCGCWAAPSWLLQKAAAILEHIWRF